MPRDGIHSTFVLCFTRVERHQGTISLHVSSDIRVPLVCLDFHRFPLISSDFIWCPTIAFDIIWFRMTSLDFLWLSLISFGIARRMKVISAIIIAFPHHRQVCICWDLKEVSATIAMFCILNPQLHPLSQWLAPTRPLWQASSLRFIDLSIDCFFWPQFYTYLKTPSRNGQTDGFCFRGTPRNVKTHGFHKGTPRLAMELRLATIWTWASTNQNDTKIGQIHLNPFISPPPDSEITRKSQNRWR